MEMAAKIARDPRNSKRSSLSGAWLRNTLPEARSPILDLKDQTIHIRMAGIDAPEVGRSFSCPLPFSHC